MKNIKITTFLLAVAITSVLLFFVLKPKEEKMACKTNFKNIEISSRIEYHDPTKTGKITLAVPVDWEILESVISESLDFKFGKGGKLHTRLVVNTVYGITDAQKMILRALEKVYSQRSLKDVDQKFLTKFYANNTIANSLSYLESQDGLWRGYYYVVRSAESEVSKKFEPFIDYILLNNTLIYPYTSKPLVIYGQVDIDADNVNIDKANQEIETGNVPEGIRCQIKDFDKAIQSLKFSIL